MQMTEVALNTLLYGMPSQSTINYFKDKVQYLQNMASSALGWAKEELQSAFNRTYGTEVLQEAYNVLQESTVMFRDDCIHAVSRDMYRPNLLTQSYLMEEPTIRKMYAQGIISGFAGTYVDMEQHQPNHIFREKYGEVVDGIVFEEENDTYVNWYPMLEDKENKLDFNQQLLVLRNWEVARSFLEEDEDPTIIR